ECILLVFLLRLLHTFTHAWPSVDKWLAISVLCGFPAVLTNFLLGALSLLLLVCLWKYYLALRDGKDNLSGLWLAVGFFKPQLILLPGILLVAARQWKAMITFLIAITILFITSSIGMGWQIWIEFLKMLRKMNDLYNSMGMEPASMYNLKGFFTRLLGDNQADLINMLSYAGLISAGIFMIYIWHGKWSTQAPVFDLRMALSLMMGLVFNLYLFPQDSLLLVLPGLLFYNYLRNRDLPRKHYVVFILLFPALFLISQFSLIPETVIKIPFLGMVVLTVWMGFALYKENKYVDKFTESNIF
ncbi:MAG: DUF2029 domain-containing protein, partial [Candidatus Atribacteria bacterium]|nr:DUF2029 domain-containing protein [Candidatus Atribacteria bacterium]